LKIQSIASQEVAAESSKLASTFPHKARYWVEMLWRIQISEHSLNNNLEK